MRKCLSMFLIFVLLLGLFSACSLQTGPLDPLLEQLALMEAYAFVAVGEITFAEDFHPPSRYELHGFRSAGQDLHAMITYSDMSDTPIPSVTLIHAGGTSFVGFVPLFQHVMNETYAPYTVLSLEDSLNGASYLVDPAIRLSNLPINFPALIDMLEEDDIREGLTYYAGLYTLTLSGEQFPPYILTLITQPFTLYTSLHARTADPEEAVFDPVQTALLAGDLSAYNLELTFMMDEEENEFTMWLTLYAPGLMTITADVTYLATTPTPVSPPALHLDVSTLYDLLAEYREAQALAILLERYEVDVVFDLPELHMTMHDATDLLYPFDIKVGEEIYTVSVMDGASNTPSDGRVHSFTPEMSLMYTTLKAPSARAAIAPFVLEYLGIDLYDGANFQRTPMRVNAHDTAAVMALHFDDNLVGRTLHIYVLQHIDDSDYALFLSIIVMLDHFTAHAYAVLDELGFLIGINFLEYVELAQLWGMFFNLRGVGNPPD